MIEITIPFFPIMAVLLCGCMIACIGYSIYYATIGKMDYVAGFILLLFILDLLSMGISYNYMLTPINGIHVYKTWDNKCAPYDYSAKQFNLPEPCKYPELNPFETMQPIHPIHWILDGVRWGIDGFYGAVKLEVI